MLIVKTAGLISRKARPDHSGLREPRMMGRRPFDRAIAFGFGLVVLILIGGAWLLLERTRQSALRAADTTLQNAMRIVESVVNRQFLQVDGALASLPALFESIATAGLSVDARSAVRLLRGLNFQTFAFRDIILLRTDGAIWASARRNSWNRELSVSLPGLISGARSTVAVIAGPIRNPVTGDWVLLVGRRLFAPGVGLLDAVAEVPLPLMTKLISAVGEIPGLRISLESRDGKLLLSQPYDELQIGRQQREAMSHLRTIGSGLLISPGGQKPTIGMARASLYDDVVIALSLDLTTAMSDWVRERNQVIVSVAIAVVLLVALALILILALRQRARAEDQIRFLADFDALTKLPNRVLFRQRMEQAIALAGRETEFAVFCLDLDNFKQINDTMGLPVGDGLLVAVAEKLQACVREVDTVARLGGDEFAIIQLALRQPDDAQVLASRIIGAFRHPFEVNGRQIMAGVSIGVTVAPGDSVSYEALMRDADIALHLAKTEGRGKARFFEPEMDARIHQRRVLELDLQGAIARNEFELYYQPQVNLASNKVCGFEALLRWHHPIRGLVSPLDFIPIVEETELIVPIGEWVLRTACLEARNWPPDITVAVNLSPVQFKKSGLVAMVQAALAASGLRPDRLELEITESVFLRNTAGTLTALQRLRALGISVALDDFGTGYSSLNYLRSFPFNKIKIDQSFVRDLMTNKESMSIVRAVTGLGQSLDMKTTAEGVETLEQLDRLREEGCTEVQGFYFSRPTPAKEIRILIQTIERAGVVAQAERV
jgi:diguanylate cyclase (GGDEF)-like protein